ncbi:replication initiation and membrane attachment family protein [Lentilactobacillus laojiaonis]|uniref:replication initiation and membrane attachment family protein n=1 Tax=Lentilactobacillus laojiaonis TaxID=2883998 RepID=UPI001D09D671|nr:DnaD domain protein [Lentilactobacillus laojiaonis]UDM32586.1 DnaD domain protein [Lentilactobacillus laojiaonis]
MGNDQINVKSQYIVINKFINSPVNYEILTNLYQPIIGNKGFSLYSLLWSFSIESQRKIRVYDYIELQSILDMGLDDILKSRKKLEATGLISTFTQVNSKRLIYEMHLPLTSEDFFKTDILSLMLFDSVGEDIYNKIIDRILINNLKYKPDRDISASPLEEFSISTSNLKNKADNLVKISTPTTSVDRMNILKNSDFNFKLLTDILENSFIDIDSVKKNMNLIVSEHLLYGLDEIALSKYIKQAIKLTDNTLDTNKLRKIIAKNFSEPTKKVTEEMVTSTPQANSKTGNQAVDKLISMAKEIAPIAFLQQLKKQKHGYVADNEQRIVREIVSRHIFSNEVINILIYHLLIGENNATLNKNLVDTIANDWSQKNVQTASQALEVIKQRKQNKVQPKKQSKRKLVAKETLPDWAKSTSSKNDSATTGLTESQKQQLQKQLDQLNKNKS